jgi:very-short-patch-repair endonuclease
MHRETSDEARSFAKSLRSNMTQPERRLWNLLRGQRFTRYKFRRQVPIEGYVAGFVCFESRLIVEADGSQHLDSKRDEIRDARLAELGFLTVRFWNHEILENPTWVMQTIDEALTRKL